MIQTLCAQEKLDFFPLGELAAYFEYHLNCLQEKRNCLLDFLAPMDVSTGRAEDLRTLIASDPQTLNPSDRNLALMLAFLSAQKASRRAFEVNSPTLAAWNLIRPFFPLWGNHVINVSAKAMQVQGQRDVYIALVLELLLRAWRMTRNGGDIQLQVEAKDEPGDLNPRHLLPGDNRPAGPERVDHRPSPHAGRAFGPRNRLPRRGAIECPASH